MKLSSQSKYLKPVYNIFDKTIVEDANLTHVLPNFSGGVRPRPHSLHHAALLIWAGQARRTRHFARCTRQARIAIRGEEKKLRPQAFSLRKWEGLGRDYPTPSPKRNSFTMLTIFARPSESVDGIIKVISRGISGCKQVIKLANASNRGRDCLGAVPGGPRGGRRHDHFSPA